MDWGPPRPIASNCAGTAIGSGRSIAATSAFAGRRGGWEQTEGPIPLLLSTGGWGIFVNTTWVHYYDLGRYEKDKAFFWGPGGQLDFYLLIGDTPAKLIELYTEITGKPRLLPLFGYGLTYVGQITQNEHEILNDARLFREKGIPCDIMGLEPQWMKKNYDTSHEKEWNPDKFYIPAWMGPNSKSGTFIGGLDRIGFKLSLWLVCRDDMTMEEERQIAIREGRGKDFPAEPDAWFNHLQKFVRNGVRAFKMDPENLIQEHPDRKYYNGRCDLENHNLTQILYHKQMCLGYEQFTNQRAMTHYCAAYAGRAALGRDHDGRQRRRVEGPRLDAQLRDVRPHEHLLRHGDPRPGRSFRLPAALEPAQQLGLHHAAVVSGQAGRGDLPRLRPPAVQPDARTSTLPPTWGI